MHQDNYQIFFLSGNPTITYGFCYRHFSIIKNCHVENESGGAERTLIQNSKGQRTTLLQGPSSVLNKCSGERPLVRVSLTKGFD